MSKLNVGVGEDFPLGDDTRGEQGEHLCAHHWRRRHGHHHHGPGPAAAILIVPAGVAAVTTAILYPLTTLGIVGGLGAVAAAYRHGRRRERWRERYRRWREEQERAQGPQAESKSNDTPRDEPPAGPKETL